MAERYFLKHGEAVDGPLSLKKLQESLAAKKFKSNDLVGVSDSGPWVRMATVHKAIRAGQPLTLPSQEATAVEEPPVTTKSPREAQLTSCKDCGQQISTRAASCPHCGGLIAVLPELPKKLSNRSRKSSAAISQTAARLLERNKSSSRSRKAPAANSQTADRLLERNKSSGRSRKSPVVMGEFASFGNLEHGVSLGVGDVIKCIECEDVYGCQEIECVHCGAPNTNAKGVASRKGLRRKRKAGAVAEAFEYNKEFIFLAMKLGGVLSLVVLAIFFIQSLGKSHSGRPQLEYGNRTSNKWIELELAGKARRVEVLWQDQRWIPLEQYLGLDWAAVPDWFKALTNEKTRNLVEVVLKKVQVEYRQAVSR